MENNTAIAQKVAEVYNWLDSQIKNSPVLAGKCKACGKCCDFNEYDHRLFVTTPELIYLQMALDKDKIKVMNGGICPYNSAGKCEIHNHRFAGCRIFCCNGDKDFQSSLSESSLKRLKSICEGFQIPYCYRDLAAALNGIAQS